MAYPIDPDEGPLVYKIPEVMRLLNMSRRSVEVLIATGQLRSHKILGSRRVSRAAVDELLADTEENAEVGPARRAVAPIGGDRPMSHAGRRKAHASR